MTTGHVFIATSVDGFIARPDGDIDWLMEQSTGGEDHGYEDFIATVSGIVMGRHSFEKALSFPSWPYSLPVLVMSKTIQTPPEQLPDKVRISRLEPAGLMEQLAAEGWKRIYIDGGRVIQSFLRADLIEDMILTRIPILLGEGIPLFAATDRDIKLKLLKTKSFPSGLVESQYRVLKTDSQPG